MNKLILLTLSATGALAAAHSPFNARELYKVPCSDQGAKDCGDGCIELTWTCCPSGDRGCPATETCTLGSNGEYGCCPAGETCEGEGGVNTDASINTITVPGEGGASTLLTEATSAGGGYEQPPAETSAAVPVETPVQESSAEVVVSHTPIGTLKTETQTFVQPATTPAGIIPTPGNNSTTPIGTPPASTPTGIPSSGASFGVNIVSGLLAAAAVLLLI